MKTRIPSLESRRSAGNCFAVAALLVATISSIAVRAAEPAKPVRGEPIQSVAAPARGERIQPLAPASGAVSVAKDKGAPGAPDTKADGGFLTVGFDKLSAFKYDVPDDPGATNAVVLKDPDQQIPADVKAFSGRRVALKGFMLPLKVEGGLVTELLIMRDQSMCCYGAVPKINDWVSVKMTSKGVKPVMDQAVTLQGTLKVGAIRENGYLVGIYQMDGEKVNAPGL